MPEYGYLDMNDSGECGSTVEYVGGRRSRVEYGTYGYMGYWPKNENLQALDGRPCNGCMTGSCPAWAAGGMVYSSGVVSGPGWATGPGGWAGAGWTLGAAWLGA